VVEEKTEEGGKVLEGREIKWWDLAQKLGIKTCLQWSYSFTLKII
jgi:hypothetical protein